MKALRFDFCNAHEADLPLKKLSRYLIEIQPVSEADDDSAGKVDKTSNVYQSSCLPSGTSAGEENKEDADI